MIFFGHLGITLLVAYLVLSRGLKEKIDYRLLVAGAVLPDLIDKPIGHYLLYDVFQNGRIFAHTALFVLLLAWFAYYVERKYRYAGIGVLALGAAAHLAEDQIWGSPATALWPLLGWEFPKLAVADYSGYIWRVLFTEPGAYVPEIAGLAIIAWFVYRFGLWRPGRIKTALTTGMITTT